MARLLLWSALDGWRAEVASVDLSAEGVRATGTQLGIDPLAYRLDYRLDASEGFVTRSLDADVTGEGWSRRLRLSHDGDGGWECEADGEGDVDLPAPGGDVGPLGDALDCDLGLSPLTNVMPIRRHALHEQDESMDFVMAWVSVPDLGLHSYPQRYEHVRRDAGGAVVRFVDKGLSPGFVSELVLDRDGLVLLYPELARRVETPSGAR